MDAISNTPDKKKFSRRDFLKSASAGLAVATAVTLTGLGANEIASNRSFISGLKVLKELSKAELSKDQNKIIESRKLALSWIFAESTIKFGPEVGLERSANAMEHFMYGHGEKMNIDKWLEERSTDNNFWEKIINQGYEKHSQEFGEVNALMDGDLLNRFIKRLKMGYTFGCNPGVSGTDDQVDLFYAFGRSTYNLKTDAVVEEVDGYRTLNLKNIDLNLKDKYDWDKDFSVGLSKKSKKFASEIVEKNIDWFLNSEDKVLETLRSIGLSEKEQKIIADIYEQCNSKLQELPESFVAKNVSKVESWATGEESGEIKEIDLSLLKKIGATDYDIEASLHMVKDVSIYI